MHPFHTQEHEDDIDEMMEELEEQQEEEGHHVSAQHIWELADRNGDEALGYSELKRAMRNQRPVRKFLGVGKVPAVEVTPRPPRYCGLTPAMHACRWTSFAQSGSTPCLSSSIKGTRAILRWRSG